MPGPVARVHALSLGHATTLRARRACTRTYIAFRSQTRRSAPFPPSASPSHAVVLLLCCCIMRQRLCPARTRRRARPRRASGNVGNDCSQAFFSSSCRVPSVPKADFPRDNQTTLTIKSHLLALNYTTRGTRGKVLDYSPRLWGGFTCSYSVTVPLLLLTFRRGPTLSSRGDGGSHGRQPQPLP